MRFPLRNHANINSEINEAESSQIDSAAEINEYVRRLLYLPDQVN